MRPRLKARHAPFAILIVVLALTPACNNMTTPTAQLVTDTMVGTLLVLGADSKPFSVQYTQAQTEASVTVTSMRSISTGTNLPVATTIGVAFGAIAADGSCARSSIAEPAVVLNQEKVTGAVFSAGIWCVQIYDSGTLTEPINYTLVVKHY